MLVCGIHSTVSVAMLTMTMTDMENPLLVHHAVLEGIQTSVVDLLLSPSTKLVIQ